MLRYTLLFFTPAAATQTYTLSLHDALPIWVRNRRQLNSLQNTWPCGYSMPIAVRYTQDAFSRSGWLWPVDAKGEPLKATSYMAVDRKSGSAGMPRPISYAVFCLKKKKNQIQ